MTDVAYKPVGKPQNIYVGGGITPPKFMPSLYEWLKFKGIQFIRYAGRSADGTTSIYTVPSDSVLFITNAFLNVFCDGGGGGSQAEAVFIIDNDDGNNRILNKIYQDNLALREDIAECYYYPLMIKPNSTLKLTTTNMSGVVQVNFKGFLVRNSDIPAF